MQLKPRKKQALRYRYKKHKKSLRWGRLTLFLAFSGLLVFGLARLIGYGVDLFSSRRTSQELRALYDSSTPQPTAAEPAPAPTESPAPPEPTAAAEASPPPAAEPSPAPTARPKLPALAYPNNPKRQINSRFRILRQENKDIVGWLSINRLVEEAVVQRNHTYYLDHDARRNENVNGAIFLDVAVSLKTRPYTLLLYGHNMKTGAMFGCLRNYETAGFYRSNPWVSFDSIYEEGRYVIFAVGEIGVVPGAKNYVDLYFLNSDNPLKRQNEISALVRASLYTCPVDVQATDQLLRLTCVEDDNARRVVAARRIRDGEDAAELEKLAKGIKKSRQNILTTQRSLKGEAKCSISLHSLL